MEKRCCAQASLPSNHQHCSHKEQRKKVGTADKAGSSYSPQHIPQYTPLGTTTQSDCSPCQLSTGKAAGNKFVLSCWKQKRKFTLSQANFSKSFWETGSREKRWWIPDTGQQHFPYSHRSCKSLFYVSMFIFACPQAASASGWTQTRGHRSLYWVPLLVPKATPMCWDSPERCWRIVPNRAAAARIQLKSKELAVTKSF